MYAVAMGFSLVLGFATGLFTFRQKSRWCTVCGCTLACPERLRHFRAGNPHDDNRGPHFFRRP